MSVFPPAGVLTRPRAVQSAITLLALGFALIHAGPLHGSPLALGLVVLAQVYWPGVVLARALGRLRRGDHPLVSLSWILAAGLGLTIVLGGLARLFEVPVIAYLLVLHGLLLVLGWLPARTAAPADGPVWRFERRSIPLYTLLVLLCVLILAITAVRRQWRFTYYPDETVFAGLASWVANVEPDDLGEYTRRVGYSVSGDIRMLTDGWTYNHAAWEWSCGVPASTIVWSGTSLLFAWLMPLITFAGVYVLTRRETLATWAGAAMTLLALLSIDNFVYVMPTNVVYGRALFELGFLRDISTTIMLPLSLFVVYDYWQRPGWRTILIGGLSGIALGMVHPRAVMVLITAAVPATGLWWLVQPGKRFKPALGAALIIALSMALPLIQRASNVGNAAGVADTVEADVLNPASAPSEDAAASMSQLPGGITVRREIMGDTLGGMAVVPALVFEGLPLLGASYIVAPDTIFYSPLLILAAVLGLAAGLRWRRSLAAQVAFAGTLAPLALLFIPGLAPLAIRFVSFSMATGLIFALPVGLILGGALEAVLDGLAARLGRLRPYLPALGAGLWLVVFLEIMWEPVPFSGSGLDQIRTINDIQAMAHVLPADDALSQAFKPYVPGGEPSVVVADVRAATVVQEDVPYTLITGGRPSGNLTYPATARFFNEKTPHAPWLDSADLAFLREVGATHIIAEAGDSRVAQMQLQPERFPLLDGAAGYLIFGVGDLEATGAGVDAIFAEMNAIYAGLESPRWTPDGFFLVRPADPAPWRPVLARWEALLAASPDDLAARLGLAFTLLMMDQDEQALPEWETLHAARPDSALIAGALAATHSYLDNPGAGRDILLGQLDSAETGARLLAARRLLSTEFLYLLDESQLDRTLAVTDANPAAWELLAEFDYWPEVRARAALLAGRGRLAEAEATLLAIPIAERGPDDLISLALIRLTAADPDGALAALAPALDPDQRAASAWLHPDRWESTAAIQVYHLLKAADPLNSSEDAIAAYRQAVAAGSTWAGRALLRDALRAAGQTDEAGALAEALAADWSAVAGDRPLPEFRSLRTLDPASPYASGLTVTVDDAAHRLTVDFAAASPPGTLAVREWRIIAASPDAATRYAEVRLPAVWVPDDLRRAGTSVAWEVGSAAWVTGALARVTATLDLPADLPALTPVRVFVQPAYDNRVIYPAASANVVVQRPASAAIPAEAIPLGVRFVEGISLHAALIERDGDAVAATLYWEADGPVGRDYQVFVHALDAAGGSLIQADSAPLDGRYPTGQWLPGTVIADPHRFRLPAGTGAWRLYVGLYSLPEGARLPVDSAPEGIDIQDSGVIVP